MLKTLPDRRNSGFTLIEVLIALLILLVGLLGVAGVQALSLQQAGSAHLRSQVNAHAQNMVELIRANGAGFLDVEQAASWQSALVRDVPGATSNVTFDGNGISITISWTERQLGKDAASQTFSLRSRLAP